MPLASSVAPERPSSRSGERPSSRNSNRSRQPRLGVASTYTFDDEVMSEAETASTRFRRSHSQPQQPQQPVAAGGKGEKGGSNRAPRPRTSPNSHLPKGNVVLIPGKHFHPYPPASLEDDSGIMSEAETSSTTRAPNSGSKRRSRSNQSSGLAATGGQRASTQHRQSRQHRHHQHAQHMSQPPLGVSSTLFEEDPGIMSEAETASTSSRSRRKNQKPSLPVVRTPSKTLERPLGVVFLIYRGETRRALLPNEITSIITVKALFVRSFSKELTLDYLDSPRVKIYIHDNDKDVFHVLGNLEDIRDRTILKVR